MRLQLALLAQSLAAATAEAGVLRVDALDDRGHVTRVPLVRDGMIPGVDEQRPTDSSLGQAVMRAKMTFANGRTQAMLATLALSGAPRSNRT